MTLERAYKLAGVNDPLALHKSYCKKEQRLFKSRKWDYDNPRFLYNKIKVEIEQINLNSLSEEEREWCREILWFWHHHAISCASWKNDKTAAQFHATRALQYQDPDPPNKITRLFFYLLHDQLEEAKQWTKTIINEDGPLALELIESYEQGLFFGPSR